ncbi:hypothetical protein vseg_006110 [Gypsophila vaccaria]
MVKKDLILDDFTLINAFDQTISKYKKMHGKEYTNCSTNDVSADVLQNDDKFESDPEMVGDGNDYGSHVLVVAEEAECLGTFTETEVTDSQISKEHALEACTSPPQDQSHCSNSTSLDEYNMLYKQYYEIEEQRQKILEKMQQLSNEYYPDYVEPSVSGMQWGTNSATQECQGASQMPGEAMVDSCCPCVRQYSTASCAQLDYPSASNHGADHPSTKGLETNTTIGDVDFVATALGAAEKALSSLKGITSGSEKGNKLCNLTEQNADSETDLSTVLHAWYSAGFYTGKYLTEKSLAKKRHG